VLDVVVKEPSQRVKRRVVGVTLFYYPFCGYNGLNPPFWDGDSLTTVVTMALGAVVREPVSAGSKKRERKKKRYT